MSKRLKLLSAILLFFLQLGFTFQPAGKAVQTVWMVGYDPTGSVPGGHFPSYPAVVRQVVLELLRPGDVIIVVRATDRPDDPPKTFALDRRLSRFEQGVREIYNWLSAVKQARGRHHTTDLGLVLEHARRRMELDRKLGAGPVRYRILLVTDGIATGQQTLSKWASPAQGDWKLVYVGVQPGTEGKLGQLMEQAGLQDEGRILGVPFTHWKELTPSLPQFLGRPINPQLVKILSRPAQAARESRR